MTQAAPIYRGRFAPSPTGPLHEGSLLTAVGSYLEAKSRGGEWLLRMEDLDPPREPLGAADDILRTLEAFGFEWDGPVAYQSRRQHLYQQALERLIDGRPRVLVQDGKVDEILMQSERISPSDLAAALRAGGCLHAHEVARATIEVNGQITVVLRPSHLPPDAT